MFNDPGWIGHTGVISGYQAAALHPPHTQTTLLFAFNTDVPHKVGPSSR